jgi:hypothetical protein
LSELFYIHSFCFCASKIAQDYFCALVSKENEREDQGYQGIPF